MATLYYTNNMDHRLSELDECLFDYLSSNSGAFISLNKILTDITSDKGHRCSELKKRYDRQQLITCAAYDLDNKYNNIYKTVRNGHLYLAYSDDKINDPFDYPFDYYHKLTTDKIDSSDKFNIVDDCFNIPGPNTDKKTGSMVHLLVRDND